MSDVSTVIRRIRRCGTLRRLGPIKLALLCVRLEAKRDASPRAWMIAWLATSVLNEVINDAHAKSLKTRRQGY